MVIVRLRGGLGNQLFQYAAGRTLAERHGVPLRYDARWYADPRHQLTAVRTFDLPHFRTTGREASPDELAPFAYPADARFWTRLRCRLGRQLRGRRLWSCEQPGYAGEFARLPQPVLIEGYFQDLRFFEPAARALAQDLRLGLELPANVRDKEAALRAAPSVCIQVRRTDFVSDAATAQRHGSCGTEYFRRAWGEILRGEPAARGFVFTDDHAWAVATFGAWPGVEVVGPEFDGPAYLHRFHLMTACRHFVIANSTWGWWAAWLGRDPAKRVVMPERWFADEAMNRAAAGLRPAGWTVC